MQTDLKDFQDKIGYTFKKEDLLLRAFSHSSYVNERQNGGTSNERLEFLGDSVLGFITAEYFYLNFTKMPEGELTKLRAATVCESSLFSFAKELDLGNFLLLGRGETVTGGNNRPSILADAFEALLAAIYLDGGMGAAKRFALNFIKNACDKAEKKGIKEALVVMNDAAFIVNAASRTVITALDKNEMKDNVFTNIDGALFI